MQNRYRMLLVIGLLTLGILACGTFSDLVPATEPEEESAEQAEEPEEQDEEPAEEAEEPVPKEEEVPEPTEVPPTPTEEPAPTEEPPTPTPTPAPLTVLLVIEDALSGRADFTSSDEIASSLDALGVEYETWGTYDDGAPTASFMSDYPVVIWSVGDDCCDSPPLESINAMVDYLDDGGNLLIEGGAVLHPWKDHPFALDYLNVQWTGYSSLGDLVVEDPDHPLAEGFPNTPISLNVNGRVYPITFEPKQADVVFVRGPKSAEVGKASISAYDSGHYRTILSTVPLQWFGAADRELFLKNALDWLSAPR
jgi:hypothetical protein